MVQDTASVFLMPSYVLLLPLHAEICLDPCERRQGLFSRCIGAFTYIAEDCPTFPLQFEWFSIHRTVNGNRSFCRLVIITNGQLQLQKKAKQKLVKKYSSK